MAGDRGDFCYIEASGKDMRQSEQVMGVAEFVMERGDSEGSQDDNIPKEKVTVVSYGRIS